MLGLRDDLVRYLDAERIRNLSEPEAYGALPVRATGYGDRPDLAQYGQAPMSIPKAGSVGLHLSRFHVGYERELLDNPSWFFSSSPNEGLLSTLKPYMDPVLAQGGAEFSAVVDEFLDCGLTEPFADVPKEQVGVFLFGKTIGPPCVPSWIAGE